MTFFQLSYQSSEIRMNKKIKWPSWKTPKTLTDFWKTFSRGFLEDFEDKLQSGGILQALFEPGTVWLLQFPRDKRLPPFREYFFMFCCIVPVIVFCHVLSSIRNNKRFSLYKIDKWSHESRLDDCEKWAANTVPLTETDETDSAFETLRSNQFRDWHFLNIYLYKIPTSKILQYM